MPETIEKSSITEVDKLYTIEKECFPKDAFTQEHLAFLVTDRNCICLVYKVEEEIVAFIMGWTYSNYRPPQGHILTLDVSPEHRRKGIGIKLLMRLEEELRGRGVEVCLLEVREDNAPAFNLYHKMGYKKQATLKGYYGIADGLLLQKDLS